MRKEKEYLKRNPKCEIKLYFQLIENGTKKVKKEVTTTSYFLQDAIIYLNNEIIIM